MTLTDVQILFIVNYLHFVSSGLVAPSLPYHFVTNGGNQILLGFLVSATYVCYKISRDFIALFELRKKNVITFCLYFSFITFSVLVLFRNRWVIFADRVVYALTNQITWFCKTYVGRTQPRSSYVKICNLLDIVNVIGTATGALIGGYAFDFVQDFTLMALAAALLTLLALYFAQNIEPDPISTRKRAEFFFDLPTIWYDRFVNLRETDYREKWDSVLLIGVYTFSSTIYYSRYAFFVSWAYYSGTTVIGKAVAYQCVVKFIIHLLVPFFKIQIVKKTLFFNWCLIICALMACALFVAPSMLAYNIIFVPLVVSYCFINEFLADDIFKFEHDVALGESVATIRILVSGIGPICFGILCHFYGRQALRVLLLFPIMALVHFVRMKIVGRESEFCGDSEEEEEEKEEEEEAQHYKND
ncbi:hypothetical protein Zmor_028010 [Zophobas morio]|uniref:Uncharacterized protein n=1 Tax=Zophobas morio TaxID=2755281 RepID=A0AA38HUP6_9CUCU|nr:hypothetical protein Zmor_028010 [Zophobas morio]